MIDHQVTVGDVVLFASLAGNALTAIAIVIWFQMRKIKRDSHTAWLRSKQGHQRNPAYNVNPRTQRKVADG